MMVTRVSNHLSQILKGNIKCKMDAGSSEKGKKVIQTQSKIVKPKSQKEKNQNKGEKCPALYWPANFKSPTCQGTCVMYTSGRRKDLERFCPNITYGSEKVDAVP